MQKQRRSVKSYLRAIGTSLMKEFSPDIAEGMLVGSLKKYTVRDIYTSAKENRDVWAAAWNGIRPDLKDRIRQFFERFPNLKDRITYEYLLSPTSQLTQKLPAIANLILNVSLVQEWFKEQVKKARRDLFGEVYNSLQR